MKSHIFVRFLKKMGVRFNYDYTTQTIEKYPYKYSLYGISQLLHNYNIENAGFRLKDKANVFNITPPFIAEYSSDFVIITKILENKVEYDWYGDKIFSTRLDFIEKFSGVVLLATPSQHSAEPNYSEHKKETILSKIKKSIILFCLLSIVLFCFFRNGINNNIVSITLLTNIIGLYMSYLLLMQQMKIHNNVAEHLCNLSSKKGCNNLLEVKAAKFLGTFGWSEIGFSYFGVNIFAAVLDPNNIYILSIFSLCTIVYAIWSLVYQKFIAKIWCPLCLVVQGVFLIQFYSFVHYNYISVENINVVNLYYIIVAYIVILMFINLTIPIILDSLNAIKTSFEFNSIKANKDVFLSLLAKENEFENTFDASKIIFGDPNAKHVITVFSNPFCGPCAKMHKRLDSLRKADCCIQYIFAYFYDYAEINKYIIAMYLKYGQEQSWEYLNDWYNNGKFQYKEFFRSMHLSIEDQNVINEFDSHDKWKINANFPPTPTVLYNNKRLPSYYNIEDLLYIIDQNKVSYE